MTQLSTHLVKTIKVRVMRILTKKISSSISNQVLRLIIDRKVQHFPQLMRYQSPVLHVPETNVKFTKAKEKYRGVFEIQKSGDKTSSGEIGLDIRTHASPKVGQDQVSGGVSVLCWHAAPVAYVLWKPCTIR